MSRTKRTCLETYICSLRDKGISDYKIKEYLLFLHKIFVENKGIVLDNKDMLYHSHDFICPITGLKVYTTDEVDMMRESEKAKVRTERSMAILGCDRRTEVILSEAAIDHLIRFYYTSKRY